MYVAAQGPLFSAGGERGLYKTTNGGLTWDAVLTISENTGVSDVDPRSEKPERDLCVGLSAATRRGSSDWRRP